MAKTNDEIIDMIRIYLYGEIYRINFPEVVIPGIRHLPV